MTTATYIRIWWKAFLVCNIAGAGIGLAIAKAHEFDWLAWTILVILCATSAVMGGHQIHRAIRKSKLIARLYYTGF
jgi:hypothetical protein